MTSGEAYIILNLLPGIGAVRVRNLVQIYGCPEAILERPAEELSRLPGVGAKLAGVLAGWRQQIDLDRELRLTDQAGAQVIGLDDPAYPEELREIHDPPLALYVSGNLSALQRTAKLGLGIVGSRRHTHYGISTTQRFVRSAVQAGWIVISGLARGIDTVAHQTTVENGGCTIAVLGGGLAQLYPPENKELARAISESGGAVVTEQPMLMKPDKRTFPMRNRIIAGMSRAVLVVEAGEQSGALITAQQGLEQGRNIYAVPGRIDAPQSSGCNRLIKNGAKLVESLDDIMEDFCFLPGFDLFDGGSSQPRQQELELDAQRDSLPELSPQESRIVAFLRDGERPLDAMVEGVGDSLPTLLATLSMLELKRIVRQLPGRHYALYTTS